MRSAPFIMTLVLFLMVNPLVWAQRKTTFVTIGTGGVTGIYYPTGGAIAKMVNKKNDLYHIKANVESTAGSVYNINAILAGDLEFGIAQSDRQYQAWHGLNEWAQKGSQNELRAICSLHPEIVTLVASEESGIRSLTDLKGKRVNIGNPGSGHRQNAIHILESVDLDWKKDIKALSLKAANAPRLLQDSRIDAFFYTISHPAGIITEATSGKRKIVFVPIEHMNNLIKNHPYYAKAQIPVEIYPMSPIKGAVSSVAVMTTFVTSARVSDDVVYAVTKELFDNIVIFKKLHPAFANLTVENMLKGLSAPLHPGAARYFEEAGLLEFLVK